MQNKKSTNEANLYLYDEIGFWGIDAKEFVDELNGIDADTIHLRINSPGGDVFAAKAMQTALMQHPAKIVTHIDGIAASAASVIAMAGDEIEMVDGGFLMIHKALSFFDVLGYFNDDNLKDLMKDMKKERTLLAKVDTSIANEYAKRTGKDVEEIKGKMADETWFDAQEAVEYGMIDRVYEGEPVENKYDLSLFAKVPDGISRENYGITKRETEKALRDAGLSSNMAKSILSKGWIEENDIHRDVESDLETQPEETLTLVNTEVEIQREVEEPEKKKSSIAELLTRAELMAPAANC